MADFVDLKRTKAEKKADQKAITAPGEGSDYPYGLEVRLGAEELEKLGMTENPTVGEEYTITGRAVVTDVSQHSSERGEDRRNVTFQFQQMAAPEKATAKAEKQKSVRDDLEDSVASQTKK